MEKAPVPAMSEDSRRAAFIAKLQTISAEPKRVKHDNAGPTLAPLTFSDDCLIQCYVAGHHFRAGAEFHAVLPEDTPAEYKPWREWNGNHQPAQVSVREYENRRAVSLLRRSL